MITRKVTTADLIGVDDQSTKNQVFIIDTGVGIGSASTGAKLFIDQNSNGISISIDSESTTTSVINVAAATASGSIINVDGSSLTSGRICNFSSNSASTATRSLIRVLSDNTLATGTTVLEVRQDAANQAIVLNQTAASSFIDYQGTAAANATDPISTLTTSGATTNHIQIEINGVKAWIAVSTTDPS